MWVPKITKENIRYRAIVDHLVQDVAQGRLKVGERLPSQRDLADRLGVTLSTVSRAYSEAARRRLIGGEVGRGTYVLGYGIDAAGRIGAAHPGAAPVPAIDLASDAPAVMAGDDAFLQAIGAFDAAERDEVGRYPSPALIERARDAIAQSLVGRGMSERPQTIVPCVGARAALQMTLVELTRPGDPVLVEAFAFQAMKALALQLGLRMISMEQDEEGVLPQAFHEGARKSKARVAVMMSSLQKPTGSSMGQARRHEIAEAARRHDVLVVEDDVLGGLTDAPALCNILGERGVLVSSLSKTVLPGLRFGFVASSAPEVAPLAASLPFTSLLVPSLCMIVASRWLTDGTARMRGQWQRDEMLARWAMMVETLGPSAREPAPHAWLRTEGNPQAAAERCRAAGVTVVPSPAFATGRRSSDHVWICLSAAASRVELSQALHRLADLGLKPDF